jgi:hypothetical protein
MSDFIKAIPVVPSATLNIPEPGAILSKSSSTNGTTVTFVSGKNLIAKSGDVIQTSQTGSIQPEEIHQIISVNTVGLNTEYTLSTPVAMAAPYDFKVYRANGGSLLEGNSGYSLLVQLGGGDMIKVIPVGQTEEVEITDEGITGLNIVDVLSQIKVQRVTESDASNIIAFDTD